MEMERHWCSCENHLKGKRKVLNSPNFLVVALFVCLPRPLNLFCPLDWTVCAALYVWFERKIHVGQILPCSHKWKYELLEREWHWALTIAPPNKDEQLCFHMFRVNNALFTCLLKKGSHSIFCGNFVIYTCYNYFPHNWKLVGEKSWLACGPGGLGLDTPGLNTGDVDAQPVLHDGSTICVADIPRWSVGLVFPTWLRLASLDLCLICWNTVKNIC